MKFAVWLLLAVALPCAGATADAWPDYQIIQWQARSEAQLAALKRIGVTAGVVIANRDGTGTPVERQTGPLLANGLRWYVENIATDFYAPYHRWFPGRPVNWRFVEAQRRYRADPSDERALWRDPSLADVVWQRTIRDRLMATVREQERYHPLYYSLGDETGIADLSAFWDFDMSPGSLADMREWLRKEYGSLDAVNAEWGTHFARWDAVRPETTREAMRRSDDNFAAWGDFKAWMDVAFARALRMGTDAVHAADPLAFAAIEGAQTFGWGGYDYTLLVNTVDVMESDEQTLVRSLNPSVIILTTSFGAEPADIHAIWQALLLGGRGVILWDPDNSVVALDGTLRPRGRTYRTVFRELHRIAPLLMASQPHADPVAILYSPASFRTQWMLDQKPKGDAWMSHMAEMELEGNAVRSAMWGYARSLAHLGLQPVFMSPAMLERGELLDRGIRLLILPQSIALSRQEVRAIRAFALHGGTVIANTPPGLFDQHSRREPRPLLTRDEVTIVAADDVAALARAVVSPMVGISAPQADVSIRSYRRGDATIIAVQRDFSAASGDETVVLTLPQPAEVYDLRDKQMLGRTDSVTLTLDTVSPALVLITP